MSGTYIVSLNADTSREKFDSLVNEVKDQGGTIVREVFSDVMGTKLFSATLPANVLTSLQSNLAANDITGIEPEGTVHIQ